jgi:hypothetical protein
MTEPGREHEDRAALLTDDELAERLQALAKVDYLGPRTSGILREAARRLREANPR